MPTTASIKKNETYGLASAAGAKVKVGGMYVDAPGLKIKGNGAYASVGVAPANTTIPSIAGLTPVGSVLTCTTGIWTGTPTPVLIHQWMRSGTRIPNAIGLTYTTQAADQGLSVDVIETAANQLGATSIHTNAIVVT